ncbi:hypothetical protein BLNAU_14516 [Blattamonas nauphoetae]|uniref:Uncharacterized protein n=1 Tax=Blattamonas nauphoetae TaxID=2049346 RepID=A0ABQ9XGS8_9EUKA|nr:hypothetical protein BLNAU_14516 [Blattamonas nauphoetae]
MTSLVFDLHFPHEGSWYACSLTWNSHVSASLSTFLVDAGKSPFVLVPSTSDLNSACSLTVSRCMLKNEDKQIVSFLEIDPALPSTESISISISSLQLDSHTLTSNSGLSFSSLPSEYGLTNDWQIQSVVSDCQFFNLSSSPAHPTSRSFRWLRERIVGCEVKSVRNNLEGTLMTRLGTQSEFLIQNSSLLECVNEADADTTKSYDSIPEITSSAQRINHGSDFTHYAFRGCTIKATNMTTSFVLITLNPLSGNVEFVGCSFEVEYNTQHNTLISATAVRANKVKCLIDTCTFKFWRETETSTDNNQISLSNFQEVSVVSSTFSPPSSKFSSARALYLSNPVSFLFFSNNTFTRQTSNGNGGALSLSFSLIRFFHCHFEGEQLATIHADVARVLHLLRDNNFQYVAPCLITWESVFRYALRLDVTDITNPVVKLNLRFGDICPLFKKAYEQDTTPIDDSPPPPLARRFEDMESEDGHFDTSKIEQSVKTAMGNADVGAYTSLSSYSPAILGGIFYTPNIGHLIKPEKMIVLTEGQCFGKIDILHQSDQGEEPGEGCDLWRTSREATAPDDAYSCEFRDRNRIVCSNLFHTSKQTRASMHLHANATTPRYPSTHQLCSLQTTFRRFQALWSSN